MIELVLGLLAVIGAMFFKIKIDKNTIDNQDNEIAKHEKEDDIIEDMKLADIKIEGEKNEAIENIDDNNWKSNI